MKRDMDLIRALLLKLEAIDKPPDVYSPIDAHTDEIQVDNYSADQISGHLSLLIDAGFVDAEDGGSHFGYRKITWEGADFLDSVRDDDIWRRTKDGALAAKGFTVDLLVDIAKGFIKKQFEERTGIAL